MENDNSRAFFGFLHGYSLADLPKDIIAGLVIAALSIPVAMGYAQIAGLPAVYGLYGSIIPPIIYALVTSTKRVVLGMDSATTAVTGGVIVSCGFALGSPDVVAFMPALTFCAGIILFLMALFRAGRLVNYVPAPVLHGFIAGISLAVIVGQVPKLFGITTDLSGNGIQDIISVASALPQTHMLTAAIGLIALAILALMTKFFPKLPNALIVLVIGTVASTLFGFEVSGVTVLGEVQMGLPHFVLTDIPIEKLPMLLPASFTVAIIVAIESLLCVETFSAKEGQEPDANRELMAFGFANAVAALFAIPAASGSISRTAAGESAGGKTQISSIIAALVVLIVVLVAAPYLYAMPEPVLAAIVTLALVHVVNFKKIIRYAEHMKIEFVVFLLSAVVVFVFGAVVGVIFGIVLSFGVRIYRLKYSESPAYLGVMKSDEDEEVTPVEAELKLSKQVRLLTFSQELTFINIDAEIKKLLEQVDERGDELESVILDMSQIRVVDATATDKMLAFVSALRERGLHVKIVRSFSMTNDSYTRYELRRIMGKVRPYPSVETAVAALIEEGDA